MSPDFRDMSNNYFVDISNQIILSAGSTRNLTKAIFKTLHVMKRKNCFGLEVYSLMSLLIRHTRENLSRQDSMCLDAIHF